MVMENKVIIFGAGGHAVSVLDALLASKVTPAFILDDDPAKKGRQILQTPVRGALQELPPAELGLYSIVVAIAVNSARKRVVRGLTDRGVKFAGVRHPSAVISPFAEVHPTAQVLARVIVNAGAAVGAHAVLNTGCIIEHDARVKAFTHIGPGAVLAGAVIIEEGAFVATGAKVCPFVRVGRGSTLGPGLLLCVMYHRVVLR
jgi:sugar O-acyltransferase (sialic acid O-acetyltransferase NeuD family)